MKGRQDVAVAIVGTMLGLGALIAIPVEIPGQSYAAIENVQSPAFFPILISLLLIGLGLLLLASRLRNPTKAQSVGLRSDEVGPVEAPGRLLATAICLIAYYSALTLIGMVTASVVLIAALALILGYRRFAVLGTIALALPVAIYLAFEKGLFVLLPAGRIF